MGPHRCCCCLCTNRWPPGGWPCPSFGPPGPEGHSLSCIPGTTCLDGWKHQGAAGGGSEQVSAKHNSLASTFTSLFLSVGGGWSHGPWVRPRADFLLGLRAPAASREPRLGRLEELNRRPSSGPGQTGQENGRRGQRAQHQVSLSPPSFRLSLWPAAVQCCLWTLH